MYSSIYNMLIKIYLKIPKTYYPNTNIMHDWNLMFAHITTSFFSFYSSYLTLCAVFKQRNLIQKFFRNKNLPSRLANFNEYVRLFCSGKLIIIPVEPERRVCNDWFADIFNTSDESKQEKKQDRH